VLDDALDLPRDENGRVVGYLVGKAAKLADWHHKKDKESFKALCARLRTAKWQREAKTDPRKKKLKAAKHRRYNAKPENKARQLAGQKRRRLEAYKRNPTIFTCVECGAVWCRAPWVRGVPPRFCGSACRLRWKYQARTKGARRIKRREGRA
jgi:hypothetical protein